MTSAEEDAAILRVIKERAEARRKFLILQGELHAAEKVLAEMAGALHGLGSAADLRQSLSRIEAHKGAASPAKVHEMMKEYFDLSVELTAMNKRARELGID